MTPSVRRKRIRRIVEELLEQYHITTPPVSVEKLAQQTGVVVRRVPGDDEVSGMLYRDAEQTVIGVNASHAITRQRFTIAHELGHLHLHPVDRLHLDRSFRVAFRDSRSSSGSDLQEIEANEFAAELLMPISMLRKDIEGHLVDIVDDEFIRVLASQYQVSEQAMTFRLTNLGLLGSSLG